MRTRTLALLCCLPLVAVAGCGFERATPFAGARLPDVGPWSDLGPVELCLAGARIVAPSLGDAGVCTTAATSGAACSDDAGCRSRERCVCGACAVAVCDSADECGPADGAFVCTFADRRCDHACDSDGQCAAGERCVPGRHVCRGACSSTADCQTGERCDSGSGLCVASACAVDGDCGGRTCAVQRVAGVVAHPSPLVTAAGVELFFEHTGDDGVANIWSAAGDGTRFVVDHMLFPGSTPSVARLPDGSYARIFAEGASLFATRSPDGVSWSAPTPALPNARQPSLVIATDGTPLL
ncbi:MAG TPA: hypothetical protein VF997_24050, partial [Polyangia bacterium]